MLLEKEHDVHLIKSKYEVAKSLEKLLQERVNIRRLINNNTGCFKKDECEQLLELLQRDKVMEDILYRIFDIQEHEYLDTSKDYIINVKIE